MIHSFLIGIAVIALVILATMVFYAGALTLLIQPGETRTGGGFTLHRPLYLNTPHGPVYPAQIVIGQDAITYTFTVSR